MREAVQRVVLEHVPGLVGVLVKEAGKRSPACVVCERADCQCSCTSGGGVAVLLRLWFPDSELPLLAAGRGVVIVADAAGVRRPSIPLADILTHTQTGVRVGGGARRLRHVAAAAVLLHHQPFRNEVEGRSGGHGERETVLLHGELEGAGLVVRTVNSRGLILLLKLLKVLAKSRLVLLAGLILQPLLQFQPHGGVDVVGLHTPGVELCAALSVPTAVPRAATWEAEAVHLVDR